MNTQSETDQQNVTQNNNTEAQEQEQNTIETTHNVREANRVTKSYVIAAMTASLIPIPVFDLVALTAIQLKLLHSLSKIYGVKFSKDIGKSATGSLIGAIIPTIGSVATTSLTKGVPVVGMAVGVASMSIFGGAATYAVGRVFTQHFESGGTFLTLNPEAVRKHFQEEFEKGKVMVSAMKADAEVESAA